MKKIKIMIVDDSPFSRTILAETLEEGGCEVVGEAESIENLLVEYDNCRPDIVTMDIAMPGADGFECTKALRGHDSAAKVILCSSMKDDELEAEARRVGAAGYVQKPVDAGNHHESHWPYLRTRRIICQIRCRWPGYF